MQKNPIVFWELASHDAEKSVKFFQDVFEWDLKMDERLGFYVIEVGKDAPEVDGGIFTLKRAKLPFLTLYILVEDIEEMAEKVVAHGGYLLEGIQSTPGGSSRLCLFNEPSGVTFAMLEKKNESIDQ
ncbi:MAG: hypothetical protein C4545_01695 [Anaerolineaceae bacterium]|jgi:predicted enzyme related to lactoylglutathione lyase|nr:MAG: hypothetical protein C4545_01695 [Anaerolineaceae bacterium]